MAGAACARRYVHLYLYTGYAFQETGGAYTSSDSVTGTFTVASLLPLSSGTTLVPLTPLSFSFSDGVQTLTNNTPGIQASFSFYTGATGLPYEWSVDLIQLITPTLYNEISVQAHTGGTGDSGYYEFSPGGSGSIAFSSFPGRWTVTDNVTSTGAAPEPDSLVLAASGMLMANGGVWRRRRR